jgi:hypothetical protein
MATNVTVYGANGQTVSIPFTSTANAAAAQAALSSLNNAEQAGYLTPVNYTGASTVSAAPLLAMLVDTLTSSNGSGQNVPVLSGNFVSIFNASTAFQTIIDSSASNQTIVSGSGGLALVNQSGGSTQVQNLTTAYIEGGLNLFAEAYAVNKGVVNLDSVASVGLNSVDIEGETGATTVNAGANTFVIVRGGGSNIVNYTGAGTSVFDIGAGVVGAVTTVTAGTGTNLVVTTTDTVGSGFSGGAVINPTSGNVTINAGNAVETVFGGTATIGAVTVSAALFTGSLTVSGGNGFFQGGTAGNNDLQTSTLASSATLVGNGSGDTLVANAAGDVLSAGSGNETLLGAFADSVGGATFNAGTGNDFIHGQQGGGNTIGLNSGTATIFGGHPSTGNNSVGDIYKIIGSGGTSLIQDFAVGFDQVSLSQSAGHPSIAGSSTVFANSSNAFNAAGTEFKLSDNSTIFFANATVTSSSFT